LAALACTLGGREGRTLFVCTTNVFSGAPVPISAIMTTEVAVPRAGLP
jgi:hypothetical protein